MRSILPVVAWAVALGVVIPGVQALGLPLPLLDADGAPDTIVGFEPGAGDAVEGLVETLGGLVTKRSDALSILVATGLTGTTLATLSFSRLVVYTEADGTTRLSGAQWDGAQWDGAQWNGASDASGPAALQQWGLDAIRAPAAWSDATPGEARLCVLDSGVDRDHPDLAANVGDASFNAVDGSEGADDDAGHGTHVAGIAAAVRDNGIGGSGVADGRILPVKVLDARGRGTASDLSMGMAWCGSHDADVALMALSVDGAPRTIRRAIDYLDAHGVVIVASAGNAGPCSGCVSYPARDPRVLATAAVDVEGRPAPFGSAGPQVDLAAPGVGIASTFDDGGYATGSGTSQAAAFAAGAALALRDLHPDMSAADVRARLIATARDLGAAGRDDATGAGLLDLEAALLEA